MLDFYRQMARELEVGPVVLATVGAVRGSVPREVGAKMLLCPDGRLIDTIGGGAGEAKVIHQARYVLETGEKTWVEIDLSGAPRRDIQGVCGGWMQVWVERWAGEQARHLVNEIIHCLEQGKPGAIVTPFAPERSPSLVTDPLQEFQQTPTELIEPLVFPPLLLILGGGHVAVPLAQVAYLAGFQIAVQDDRPEFVTGDRFPQATWRFCQPLGEALAQIPAPAPLYAALVTRGFQHDLTALRVLLQHPTRYIGMIGSRKRVHLVYQTLSQEGFAPETMAGIYAPIGLDIGALTPGEIAVSIVAELVKVRRAEYSAGTGQSLSQKFSGSGEATNSNLL